MATPTTAPDTHRDLLGSKGFAHLATIGPNGEPQSHPVWFDMDDGRVAISTTKDRQKFRNIRRDSNVAMSILDPENPYRYIEIRGRASEIEDDPERRFIDHLAGKYMNQETYPYSQPSDERVKILITPEKFNTMG